MTCRGGVGSRDPNDADYELEIGQQCNASPEMLALAAHHDEIVELLEFLAARGGNLARIVLESYNTMRKHLTETEKEPRAEIKPTGQ